MTTAQLKYYDNEFAKIINSSSVEAIAVTQEFEDYLKSSSSIIVWSVFLDWLGSNGIKLDTMEPTNEAPFRIKIKMCPMDEVTAAAKGLDELLWESIRDDNQTEVFKITLNKKLDDYIDRETNKAFKEIKKDGVEVSVIDSDYFWFAIEYKNEKVYYRYTKEYLNKFLSEHEDNNKTEDLHSGKGVKADKGKRQWSLLPFKELGTVVDILDFGAEKYAPNNWQKVDNAEKRYEDALYRHMTSWSSGEKVDPESGKSHLAHVVCNALFLMWFENNNKGDKE